MFGDTANLVWGLLFGAIGFGFFSYGKKQGAIIPLICGVCLVIVPMVFTNIYLLVAVGFALMALPYYVKI